jgi:hypothetical protein
MPRPSPSLHAKDYKNSIKIGNNNKLWVSVQDKNKIYKWKELSNKLDIYKIYKIIKNILDKSKEDKIIKTRYDTLNKNIKNISKTLNICYEKLFINNLHLQLEDFNMTLTTDDYLGDDGYYAKNEVEKKLQTLLKDYNKDNFFIITDLDIYDYLTDKTLYIYGMITNQEIITNIKNIFLNIFKTQKIKFHIINKNIIHIVIKD